MKKAVVAAENRFMSDDVFALFGLPCQFDIDADQLERHYLALQHVVHPDRFVGANAQDRLAAAAKAATLNQAYHLLKSPILRAGAYLEAKNIEIPGQNGQTIQNAAILQEIMELQEDVVQAETPIERHALIQQVAEKLAVCFQNFATATDITDLQNTYLRMVYLQKIVDNFY